MHNEVDLIGYADSILRMSSRLINNGIFKGIVSWVFLDNGDVICWVYIWKFFVRVDSCLENANSNFVSRWYVLGF